MSIKRTIPFNSGTFFITFTCVNWLPLFDITNGYNFVYKWFDFLKSIGHFVNAFVIMPNHVHVILTFSKTEKSINTIIGNGKRFIAYDLIAKLTEDKNSEILTILSELVSESDKKKNKRHEVFETSFDWKILDNDEIIELKLNYIHDNPVKGPNPIVDKSFEYYYSSKLGIENEIIQFDRFMTWIELNLNK